MIVSTLTKIADFLIKVLEGILLFFKEVIPLISKIIFTASPFALLVFGVYSLYGLRAAIFTSVGVIIFVFIGIVWAVHHKTENTSLSLRVFFFVLLADIIIIASVTIFEAHWDESIKKGEVPLLEDTSQLDSQTIGKNIGYGQKQKVFLELLENSINENSISNSDFLHAMNELKNMNSYYAIDSDKIILSLRVCSQVVDAYTGIFGSTYESYKTGCRQTCATAIEFFKLTKCTESCEILYELQTQRGYLNESLSEASKIICGQ